MPCWNRNQVSSQEMYRWYVTTVKNHVDYKTYRAVTKLWGIRAVEMTLEGRDIPLYCGFYEIGIRKRYKPVFVDHRQSKIQGKKVYGSNSHSGFYGAKIWWGSKWIRFSVKGWHFTPMRKWSRALAQVLKTPGGHKRFVERIVVSGTAIKKRRKRFKI